MASKFTYNAKILTFEEVEYGKSDTFEEGMISYLPRDCQL